MSDLPKTTKASAFRWDSDRHMYEEIGEKQLSGRSAPMQILTLPPTPPYFDARRAKDVVELRQRRLPLISLPHQTGEIFPHQLNDGSVALDRHLPRRPQQIVVQR